MHSEERILVVDDEPGITRQFVRALEGEGYRVDSAHSGEEAWEKYRQQQPIVVLTDYRMGQMSGIELAERIDQANPFTMVILITAFGDEENAIEAIHRHVFDYLQKPVDIDILLDTVKQAITRAHLYAKGKNSSRK
uniref:Response regulator receiver domain-containing protein n=1 Tax=Candidatus Kentrum sp. TUN TaxID=2126343 RepID=A0A451AMI4_9GAMM|nr:MAG: Response regulator receiver domain-containing protein [Candidatus Kentron sp. TUN]VFK67253.1 MAG: Response regulator receiver domain-containing protein [Candidatus Kentron sp. TUN]